MQRIADLVHAAPDTAVRIYTSQDAGGVELEWLRGLENVRHLMLESWDLVSFDGIARFRDLRSLRMGATRSKRPSLDCLAELHELSNLRVEGHAKGSAAIGQLARLRWLHVVGVSDRAWLKRIGAHPTIEALWMQGGGIRDLDVLSDWRSLGRVRLERVPRLDTTDLAALERCGSVQELVLDHLQRVTRLSCLRGRLAGSVRRIRLSAMQHLGTLDDLAECERLLALFLSSSRPADDQLAWALKLRTLESLAIDDPYPDEEVRALVASFAGHYLRYRDIKLVDRAPTRDASRSTDWNWGPLSELKAPPTRPIRAS